MKGDKFDKIRVEMIRDNDKLVLIDLQYADDIVQSKVLGNFLFFTLFNKHEIFFTCLNTMYDSYKDQSKIIPD